MSALTAHERETLASLLDELLPPREDARLTGAGGLGLAAAVDAASLSSPLRPALSAELTSLASGDFAALARAEKRARLEALAKQSPELFQLLLRHAYGAYYTHPSVVAALGLPARPPFPKGYEVPPTDFSLLAVLARHAGQVMSKARLLELVWGYDPYDEGLVVVRVSLLRRHLGSDAARLIHTVRGVGYVLRDDAALGDAIGDG